MVLDLHITRILTCFRTNYLGLDGTVLGQVGDWIDDKENDRANASTDGLLKNKFDNMTVRTTIFRKGCLVNHDRVL